MADEDYYVDEELNREQRLLREAKRAREKPKPIVMVDGPLSDEEAADLAKRRRDEIYVSDEEAEQIRRKQRIMPMTDGYVSDGEQAPRPAMSTEKVPERSLVDRIWRALYDGRR
jgi:hypothetical protein